MYILLKMKKLGNGREDVGRHAAGVFGAEGEHAHGGRDRGKRQRPFAQQLISSTRRHERIPPHFREKPRNHIEKQTKEKERPYFFGAP